MCDSVVLSRSCPSLCFEVMHFAISLSDSIKFTVDNLSFNKSYTLRNFVLNWLLNLNPFQAFVICQQSSLIQYVKSF
jgi:hypothetical protein